MTLNAQLQKHLLSPLLNFHPNRSPKPKTSSQLKTLARRLGEGFAKFNQTTQTTNKQAHSQTQHPQASPTKANQSPTQAISQFLLSRQFEKLLEQIEPKVIAAAQQKRWASLTTATAEQPSASTLMTRTLSKRQPGNPLAGFTQAPLPLFRQVSAGFDQVLHPYTSTSVPLINMVPNLAAYQQHLAHHKTPNPSTTKSSHQDQPYSTQTTNQTTNSYQSASVNVSFVYGAYGETLHLLVPEVSYGRELDLPNQALAQLYQQAQAEGLLPLNVYDTLSSWWAVAWGHNLERVSNAVAQQMRQLSHVMFAGTNHIPATNLTNLLTTLFPEFSHAFYSDSGSVAVEVALKIAQHYKLAQAKAATAAQATAASETNLTQGSQPYFFSLSAGYHGDTAFIRNLMAPESERPAPASSSSAFANGAYFADASSQPNPSNSTIATANPSSLDFSLPSDLFSWEQLSQLVKTILAEAVLANYTALQQNFAQKVPPHLNNLMNYANDVVCDLAWNFVGRQLHKADPSMSLLSGKLGHKLIDLVACEVLQGSPGYLMSQLGCTPELHAQLQFKVGQAARHYIYLELEKLIPEGLDQDELADMQEDLLGSVQELAAEMTESFTELLHTLVVDCYRIYGLVQLALINYWAPALAGFIFEPSLQGAAGIRTYDLSCLEPVVSLVRQHQLLVIADEIATGFGRTGLPLASYRLSLAPDVITLGKALTAGQVTMGATLCTEHVAKTIARLDYGPTFTANPTSCAAALQAVSTYIEQQGIAQSLEQYRQRNLETKVDHNRASNSITLTAAADAQVEKANQTNSTNSAAESTNKPTNKPTKEPTKELTQPPHLVGSFAHTLAQTVSEFCTIAYAQHDEQNFSWYFTEVIPDAQQQALKELHAALAAGAKLTSQALINLAIVRLAQNLTRISAGKYYLAFEFKHEIDRAIEVLALQEHLWLRPVGNVLYMFMPLSLVDNPGLAWQGQTQTQTHNQTHNHQQTPATAPLWLDQLVSSEELSAWALSWFNAEVESAQAGRISFNSAHNSAAAHSNSAQVSGSATIQCDLSLFRALDSSWGIPTGNEHSYYLPHLLSAFEKEGLKIQNLLATKPSRNRQDILQPSRVIPLYPCLEPSLNDLLGRLLALLMNPLAGACFSATELISLARQKH